MRGFLPCSALEWRGVRAAPRCFSEPQALREHARLANRHRVVASAPLASHTRRRPGLGATWTVVHYIADANPLDPNAAAGSRHTEVTLSRAGIAVRPCLSNPLFGPVAVQADEHQTDDRAEHRGGPVNVAPE
jgi:hypothetical protein